MTDPHQDQELGRLLGAAAGLEKLKVIADSTVAYKATLTRAGIGEDAADQMAVQYHAFLIAAATSSINAQLAARSRGAQPNRR